MVEACSLDTLRHARGGVVLQQLLRQPELWDAPDAAPPSDAHDDALRHLLAPPLIVVAGPANAGKSTLVNALAGRRVSVVDPRAGTTRDHVGVHVDLRGVQVMLADLPGTRANADLIERDAMSIAATLLSRATLVVRARAPGQVHADLPRELSPDSIHVSLLLQSDRIEGDRPEPGELAISVRTGEGLESFTQRLSDALVPRSALAAGRPWRFHPALRPATRAQSPTIE